MERIEEKYWAPAYGTRPCSFEPIDSYGNVNLQQFTHDFESVAGKNAEDIGIGPDYYIPNQVFFVVCRMKGEFLKPLPFDKTLYFVTYPLPIDEKIQFYRQGFVCDENEEMYFKVTSSWVLISAEKRRIVTTDHMNEHIKSVSPFVKDLKPIMEKKLRALETLDIPEENQSVYTVVDEDIDGNHHMNNTVYFKIIQNIGFRNLVRGYEIDFEKESFAGEKIKVGKIELEDSDYFIGYKEDGRLSFKAKINY